MSSFHVKCSPGGTWHIYDGQTSRLLQKVPETNLRNRVVVTSDKIQNMTAARKRQMIKQIQKSDRDISVNVPYIDVLLDAERVARELTTASSSDYSQSESESYETAKSGSSDSGTLDQSETSSTSGQSSGPTVIVYISDYESNGADSDSSLATGSWTPSLAHEQEKRDREHKNDTKNGTKTDRKRKKNNQSNRPSRSVKEVAKKALKRRRRRVYDF